MIDKCIPTEFSKLIEIVTKKSEGIQKKVASSNEGIQKKVASICAQPFIDSYVIPRDLAIDIYTGSNLNMGSTFCRRAFANILVTIKIVLRTLVSLIISLSGVYFLAYWIARPVYLLGSKLFTKKEEASTVVLPTTSLGVDQAADDNTQVADDDALPSGDGSVELQVPSEVINRTRSGGADSARSDAFNVGGEVANQEAPAKSSILYSAFLGLFDVTGSPEFLFKS